MGHLSTGVAFQPFFSIDLLQASERLRRAGNRVALLPCLCCLMDKQALRGHMWTSSQNAQLDHMHPLRRLLAHRGLAFGLTRFACQKPDLSLPTGQPIAGARPPNGGQGAQPWGSGGGTPHAGERLRRGRDAWGSRRPKAATALIRPPLWGV